MRAPVTSTGFTTTAKNSISSSAVLRLRPFGVGIGTVFVDVGISPAVVNSVGMGRVESLFPVAENRPVQSSQYT